jgi:hypothetical protein
MTRASAAGASAAVREPEPLACKSRDTLVIVRLRESAEVAS